MEVDNWAGARWEVAGVWRKKTMGDSLELYVVECTYYKPYCIVGFRSLQTTLSTHSAHYW